MTKQSGPSPPTNQPAAHNTRPKPDMGVRGLLQGQAGGGGGAQEAGAAGLGGGRRQEWCGGRGLCARAPLVRLGVRRLGPPAPVRGAEAGACAPEGVPHRHHIIHMAVDCCARFKGVKANAMRLPSRASHRLPNRKHAMGAKPLPSPNRLPPQ
jgi:hypothetical protein